MLYPCLTITIRNSCLLLILPDYHKIVDFATFFQNKIDFSSFLPEFQNFLISRQLVPEKNVPFYANWVGKFLSFLNLNRNIKEKST